MELFGSLWKFYLIHGILSAVVSVTAYLLLRRRFEDAPLYIAAFFWFFNVGVPVLGYFFSAWIIYYLRTVEYATVIHNTRQLNLDELDQEYPEVRRVFGEGSMQELISNELAPAKLKLRALVALADKITNKNVSLIKHSLSDKNDEVRLFSFALIDKLERDINDSIHKTLERYKAAKSDAARAPLAKQLAFLYWELVYYELSDEVLKAFLLDETIKYANEALRYNKVDMSMRKLLGKVYLMKKEFDNAATQLVVVVENDALDSYTYPYLAEIHFNSRNFRSVKAMMAHAKNLDMNPTLYPVVEQWSAS